MTQVDFSKLSPQMVWQHFETLCTIPRPSKHEQQLRQHLKNWAEQRNLDTYIDDIGNLIIRKAATVGKEQVAGVILQGHLANTVWMFAADALSSSIAYYLAEKRYADKMAISEVAAARLNIL